MTYERFKATLLAELKGHFPPDTSIAIHSIPRNNQVEADGLTILEPGFNITPTIYLQEYYAKLVQGFPFPAVFKQILDVYRQYRPYENIDASFFTDFSFVQHHIIYRLVHYERNRRLLDEVPHIPFLDLAIVFCCLLSADPAGSASILIRNSHLKLWDAGKEQLYALAQKNTPFLMAQRCDQMSRLLSGFLAPESTGTEASVHTPASMYVLTNEQRFFGASCLLYDELLSDLGKKLCSDFYIIPSSIHEVILVPASKNIEQKFFNDMIQEVNTTQLEPEEILSDHVYYFNRRKKRLSM